MTHISSYSLTELYGWFVPMPLRGESWDEPKPCLVCGAGVFNPDLHQSWHNKMNV